MFGMWAEDNREGGGGGGGGRGGGEDRGEHCSNAMKATGTAGMMCVCSGKAGPWSNRLHVIWIT